MKYPIGTKFKTRGKAPRECVVVDYLTTTNMQGDIVKQRYVAQHTFLGQTVTDYDVVETTIARGLI
jgi:hypothetical protein